jgi:hypothetical protein
VPFDVAGGWLAPDARPAGAAIAAPHVVTDGVADAPAPPLPVVVPMPLRPMTVTDIIDGGIAALKAAPRAVFTVTAAFVVPAELLAAWVKRDQLSDAGIAGAVQVLSDNGSRTSDTGATILLLLLQSVVLAFVATAVALLMASWYFNRPITARQALALTVRRSPAVLLAWFAVHLVEAVAALVLVVPALAAMALLATTIPALAIEGCGPIKAVRRSWRLTQPRFWSALGATLLIALVDLVLALALSGLGFVFEPFDWAWVVDSVLVGIAALVTTPFVAAATTLLYLDRRVRSEGLDIELGIAAHLGPLRAG